MYINIYIYIYRGADRFIKLGGHILIEKKRARSDRKIFFSAPPPHIRDSAPPNLVYLLLFILVFI